MRTVSWRKLLLALAVVVVLLTFSFNAFAQSDQDTQVTPSSTDESGAKGNDADRDDPNSRLQWDAKPGRGHPRVPCKRDQGRQETYG